MANFSVRYATHRIFRLSGEIETYNLWNVDTSGSGPVRVACRAALYAATSWARSREKKHNQDRTGQDNKKSQNRNISPIWGQTPRKAIAIKFGTAIYVHKVVAWAKFDL